MKRFFVLFFFFFCRELCEESMNHSVSSASSLDSHAPSESSSQSQGMRWEEQQKLLALEQLCGVFRVDLGHMRSLRLFFRSAESLYLSRKVVMDGFALLICHALDSRGDFSCLCHCFIAVMRRALVASW